MRRAIAAALPIAALAACGGEPPAGQGGEAAYRLAAISETELILHPAETRTVRVILAREQVGGVPDALVHFQVAGDPGAVTAGAQDVATGPDGVASVSITASGQTGSAELTATVPAFDAPGVTFAIQIVPVRRIVQVVGGPGTLVDPGARTASLLLSASGSAPLRVRVIDADTGEPAAGEIVFFSVPEDARAGFGRSAAR